MEEHVSAYQRQSSPQEGKGKTHEGIQRIHYQGKKIAGGSSVNQKGKRKAESYFRFGR